MAAPQSPIGPRRRLGAELRRLRNRARLTLDDVAERMTCSTSKISRLETGKGIPKVPDVRELMRIYGVESAGEQDALLQLVHDGREHGWWEPLTEGVQLERHVLDAPARYASLETDATAVHSFDMTVLFGLLQTREYMRAVMTRWLPRHSDQEIDQLVELRMRRQEALHRRDREPLAVVAVIDEAVLARRVGGPAVMIAQLERLAELAVLPNVTIRVLPFGSGALRAHAGQFVLLEIPPDLGAGVVYIESHAGDSYLEDQSDVELYQEIHADALRLAHSADDSGALIARYLGLHDGAAAR